MSIAKLEGTLVYVQVQKATKCYEESKGFEWKSSIVVDEDTADAFGELYSKQAAKAVKTADFEKIYKIPAPFPDQKKQFVITLRKNTKLANGNDVPEKYKPRVMERLGNGTLVDVTATKLPANGSKGAISVDHYDAKLGAVARLKNVLVTDMIEYEAAEGSDYEAGDEFSDNPPAAKSASKPAAKPTKAKAKVEDDSDSLPF